MSLVTAFLIGLFTEQLQVVCVFTLSFMTLRSFTGGFTVTAGCSVISVRALYCSSPVYTGPLFVRMSVPAVLVTLAAAAGIILILSPMHSQNRKLDQKEKKHFGKRARVKVILQIMMFFVQWRLGYNDCAYAEVV